MIATLLKRDSNNGVFLWILEIFFHMQNQPPEVFYIKKVFLNISQI